MYTSVNKWKKGRGWHKWLKKNCPTTKLCFSKSLSSLNKCTLLGLSTQCSLWKHHLLCTDNAIEIRATTQNGDWRATQSSWKPAWTIYISNLEKWRQSQFLRLSNHTQLQLSCTKGTAVNWRVNCHWIWSSHMPLQWLDLQSCTRIIPLSPSLYWSTMVLAKSI